LIHCGAGIGRTGTLAAGVLIVLGMDEPDALKNVDDAGSHPERRSQREVIRWIARQVGKK
jgi:protein-tyrosine phosphatase